MQLLENLNYMWLTFMVCVIFIQCWLRSRRKISHTIIITTTFNHQLSSTYSARCCKTLILSITTALYNRLYFLSFYRWGFRAYVALNHKASSVQSRNEWIYTWSDSKAWVLSPVPGIVWNGGEKALHEQGEHSTSPAGYLAGCVNALVFQRHWRP